MATPANTPLSPKARDEGASSGRISIGNSYSYSCSCSCSHSYSERDGGKDDDRERQQNSSKKRQQINVRSRSKDVGEDTEDSQPQQQQQQRQTPPTTITSSSTTTTHSPAPRKKRKICDRCHRPVPQTCLCSFLPQDPITLTTADVVVLQHPLELKNHKAASHRSLPLLELCLDSSSLMLRKGRRFGEESLGAEILSKLWGNDDGTSNCYYIPVLVFPSLHTNADDDKATKGTPQSGTNDQPTPRRYREDESTVLSLAGLMKRWKSETTETNAADDQDPTAQSSTNKQSHKGKKKILLLVLDATWKHAREMHLANLRENQYPPHMLRLALEPDDFGGGFVSGRFRLRGKASTTGYNQSNSRRAKKRKANQGMTETGTENDFPPIDEMWMSTAECIAWILSNLEGSSDGSTNTSNESSPSLYEILMKPLDAMVAKWNSYRMNSSGNNKEMKKKKNKDENAALETQRDRPG